MSASARHLVLELFIAASFAAATGTAAYHLSIRGPEVHKAVIGLRLATSDPDLADELKATVRTSGSDALLNAALYALGDDEPNAGRRAALGSAVRVMVANETDAGAESLVHTESAPGMTIVARGRTVEEARERARAMATALDRRLDALARSRLRATSSDLEARLPELDRRIRTVQLLGPSDTADSLDMLLAERTDTLEQWNATTAQLGSDEPIARLGHSEPDVRRLAPRPTRDGLAGAAAGALLGIGLGVRWPTKRTRTPRAPARRRPPVLATFPRAGGGGDRSVLRGPAARLRVRLDDVTAHVRPEVVLFAGAVPRSGATLVATQLAEELAILGRKVLLVDADLGGPGVAAAYGLDGAPNGTSMTLDWLQRPAEPHGMVRVTVPTGGSFDLIPQYRATRPAPGTAPGLYAALPEILARFTSYDAILIDGAAVLAAHDSLHIAPHVTGTVLVVDRGIRDERLLFDAVDRLEGAGATLLGVVESEVPPSAAPSDEGDFGAWLRGT